jgi:hypothetical protein
MARWLVQVEGERFDLEEFPRWFPDGDIFFTEENGAFFLTGQGLEQLEDPEGVRAEAMRALEQHFSIVSLVSSIAQRPRVSHVVRVDDDGKRHKFSFLDAMTLTARGRVGTLTVSGDKQPDAQRPTEPQQLLAAAKANPRLQTAVLAWAAPGRSWTHLQRIVREIELHLGQHVDTAKLCKPSQRDRFFFTANNAELSGINSRHATGELRGRPHPGRRRRARRQGGMDLGEATSFVHGLLKSVLLRP